MYKITFEIKALRILNSSPRMRRTCESYIDSIVHDVRIPRFCGAAWLDEYGTSGLFGSVLFVDVYNVAGTQYIDIAESINHRGA